MTFARLLRHSQQRVVKHVVPLLLAAALPSAAALHTISTETRAHGVEVRDVRFPNSSGGVTEAYLVVPPAGRTRAAILYVHWYEPPNPTSNRTQYLEEAIEMARRGAVSLLPATMWSDPEWFRNRKREQDLASGQRQIKDLQRALDELLGQPGIDAKRVAYVGHDFGAMFGAALAGMDRRPKAWALQAGASRFANWYLFGPPMTEPARSKYVDSLKAIDPVEHIARVAPAPVFFQFATRDFYVPHDDAERLWQAAKQPKKIVFYDAVHEMNNQAREDRIEWLTEVLGLTR